MKLWGTISMGLSLVKAEIKQKNLHRLSAGGGF